jgi:hypothetical protein
MYQYKRYFANQRQFEPTGKTKTKYCTVQKVLARRPQELPAEGV